MFGSMIEGLIEIIYPKACVACKSKLKGKSAVNDLICVPCWDKIARNIPPFCYRCGRHLERRSLNKHVCPACVKKTLHFDRAFSPCVYDGVIKELIHIFKYRSKDYLGQPLSMLMIEFIKEYDVPLNFIDFIIPIPLHKTRFREREFNQAQILSSHIAREFKKDTLDGVLIRHNQTKTQTDLDHQERFMNIRGSLSLTDKKEIKGKNILLVDDVLTSGATSSEAASVLKDAGAGIVFVLTLAN